MPASPGRIGQQRRGRPQRAPQAAPSALSAPLARTRITFEIPSHTVADLRDYVAWLVASWHVPEREALAATLDEALRRFIRNDRLWREQRRAPRRNVAPTAPVVADWDPDGADHSPPKSAGMRAPDRRISANDAPLDQERRGSLDQGRRDVARRRLPARWC